MARPDPPRVPEHLVPAEDLGVGSVIDLGTYVVSREEILDFATQWDPLPIHVDDEAAASGPFGEVIASGLHTLSLFQRLTVERAFGRWAVVAGRELRQVRFRAPVRAGAIISGTLTVEAVEPTRPDRSLVTVAGVLREGDADVLTLVLDVYVRRRNNAPSETRRPDPTRSGPL